MRRFVIFIILGICGTLYYCAPRTHDVIAESPYLNVKDSTSFYVGIETCRGCHNNVYHTFIETGMGKSWGLATPVKSAAGFDGHKVIYDSISRFYYKPFWKKDSLFVLEFRMEHQDTIYKQTHFVKYIVGSGQHTNSHIWEENGYLFQAPFTYYTQKSILGLPPGFEGGHNSRFERIISLECMGCHNALPKFAEGSANKFLTVHTGIDCERCHGPGSIHVAEKSKGIFVDTSKQIDYTIVNPRKLPRAQQVNLCMRCHLQGITVVDDGKSIFNFKPSMLVSDVMHVFLPRYTHDNNGKFIMASHADRMMQSNCYKNSQMTCLTCHNPHISVKVTSTEVFNTACKNCHPQNKGCTASLDARKFAQDNCYSCHMPMRETMDIPNVTVHDHRISKPVHYSKQKGNTIFTGLSCITEKNPGNQLMADGYLQFYEAYTPDPLMLDSAYYYLEKTKDKSPHYFGSMIRYYFLRAQWDSVVYLSSKIDLKTCADVYSLYHIGYAYLSLKKYNEATSWLESAATKGAFMPEVLQALGNSYAFNQNNNKSQILFEKLVLMSPSFVPAHNSLGWLYFLGNKYDLALQQFNMSLQLDPDNKTALLNKAQVFLSNKDYLKAKAILDKTIKIYPNDMYIKQVIKKTNSFL